MLYELIAVVRTGNMQYVKDIARTTSTLLLSRSSTIRSLTNWGIFDLPRPTIKHQTTHYKGHYFVLTFDSSSSTQAEVRRQLGLNPHMIRFSVVKVGDKLGGHRGQRGRIEEGAVGGSAEWTGKVDGVGNARGIVAAVGAQGGLGSVGVGGREAVVEHQPISDLD